MSTEAKQIIEIPNFITVRELAALMNVSPINVIKELMTSGMMASINQQVDYDTAAIVAEEMGYDPVPVRIVEEEVDEDDEERPVWQQILASEEEADLVLRPPVITMLGHVDHGKTSLLDVIREATVQSGEAGGITQHIGAYQIKYEGQIITFLDTPGHEAFTAMRARGAQATDIAILVIAADDGVMPQTREAADHARAARVPIIVALNKMDLATANPDRVKQQLAEIGLTPDEWDGDTLIIPVSATAPMGIEDLLEGILLTAEELRPRSNPQGAAVGTVLEARIEKGQGVVATILVQNGTLRVGDTILVGSHYGRLKAMYDYQGQAVKSAGPSTPVTVAGLNGIPAAGEQFEIVKSERSARKLVADRETEEATATVSRPLSLDDFFSQLTEEEEKSLNLIVKADVQGSLEPIVQSLNKLSGENVSVDVLHASTGNITENDVMLATASNAVILGFNVETGPAARALAASEQVEINSYTIIYHLIEDVEKALKGLLDPVYADVVVGKAEVREVFRIRNVGNIAGCFLRSGVARRNAKARLLRGETVVHTGAVASLKHLKENVREVKAGFEFGVNIEGFRDYRPGDEIEFLVSERQR